MATFTISGLWHGASWNYVLWGVYWGLLILVQRFLGWLGVTRWIPWSGKVAITFVATCAGWLLFRERNLGQVAHHLAQSPFVSVDQWEIGLYLAAVVLFYSLPLVIHMVATGVTPVHDRLKAQLSENGKFILETSIAVFLFLGILVARSVTTSDFIYFQF